MTSFQPARGNMTVTTLDGNVSRHGISTLVGMELLVADVLRLQTFSDLPSSSLPKKGQRS